MIVTGTIINADGNSEYIVAEGNTYPEARANLDALLTEGQKLIVIRTGNY